MRRQAAKLAADSRLPFLLLHALFSLRFGRDDQTLHGTHTTKQQRDR